MLRLVETRRVVSLIMSDVVGDRLDTVASGPTAPDETIREYDAAGHGVSQHVDNGLGHF